MIQAKVIVKKKHNASKGIVRGSDAGTKEALDMLNTAAKAFAPVDTGNLKGNIFQRMKRRVGYVVSKAYYSVFQEYGTSKMKAANGGKGFMRPAVDFVRTRITGIYGKNIRAGIRRS